MTQIALFHPDLGVRAGGQDAAARLSDAGHEVLVVDYNDGYVVDDHEQASNFVEEVGFPELMRRALAAGVVAAVRDTAPLELHDDYPSTGHLFTDESLPDEYGAEAAKLFWPRVLAFCAD